MLPRISKRWNSSTSSAALAKSVARKGRKGHLYTPEQTHPGPTPEEEVRIIRRRVQKAERDERMDITLALTPPKTYMGGFTRPRDLRAANWFPGGPYLQKGKIYESPPESAYEPHTVFLLESRYRVRHGIGRVDAKDHIIGVCRASDFFKLVQKYNSARCPSDAMESMDNACWPWLPKSGKVLRPTRWWGKDERLEDIMREIYEDPNYVLKDVERLVNEAEEEREEDEPDMLGNTTGRRSQDQEQAGMQGNPPQDNPTDGDAKRIPPSSIPTTPSSSSPSPTTEEPPLRSEPPHIIGSTTVRSAPHRAPAPDRTVIRAQYLPRLDSTPFWLPLIAITVSTRPLALSISRLTKAHERGLPFYASMSGDDRKCLYSYSHRMTNLRLNRFHALTLETIKRLAGHKGGFVGIRFGVGEKGRGVDGEALADPIKRDKRVVKVAVGKWYERAEDQYALYKEDGEEWGGEDAVDVGFLNEWGRRLDADGKPIPLTDEELSAGEVEEADEEADDEAETDPDQDETDEVDGMDEEKLLSSPNVPGRTKYKLKPILRGDNDDAAILRRKLALLTAQGHRSVSRV